MQAVLIVLVAAMMNAAYALPMNSYASSLSAVKRQSSGHPPSES
jgi:hypothetical protein